MQLPGVAAARARLPAIPMFTQKVGNIISAPFRVTAHFELRVFPALPIAEPFGSRHPGRVFFAFCRPSMSPAPAWQSSSTPAGYAGGAREEMR
jgi:hypothetical protein